jgi:predicted esterase
MAYRNPSRYAAIAPLAAFQTIPDTWPSALLHTPVWAFHGAKDEIAPLTDDREMVEAIQKQGGTAKLTILPEMGHDITSIYQRDELYA